MRAELADGRILEFPDGTSPEVVQATVKRVIAGEIGPKSIPGQTSTPPTMPPKTIGERLYGAAEAGLSAVTGVAALPVAAAGAVASGLSTAFSDRTLPNTPTVNALSGQRARELMESMTFRPRSETGQSIVDAAGKAFDASKLAGLPPSQVLTAAPLARPGVARAVDAIPSLPAKEAPVMPGVGAAMTDIARLRNERAQSLPVPLPLTKGMLTRDFEQQRFERETAKAGSIGEPLRERHAELNQRILTNFDAFLDQTGAEAGGLRATGEIVNNALVGKAKMARSHYKAAYDKADLAGETRQPVSYSNIAQYIDGQTPTVKEKLAPIIKAVEEQIAKNDPHGAGVIPIKAMEDIRQLINANTEFGTPNYSHGSQIKKLIDAATENAGGDLYKRARSLRMRYSKEFEDVGVIDKLMSTKPGTSDRAVAYEDVFRHSILSGSLDDVRMVRKTLQTAGPEGQQAWKELQGQTIQHIKDEITKNVSTDTRGNPVVSAARLNRVITELDKDGKLDFIFGKQGAQHMRDINEAAKDVLTFPPGSVNTSTTASVLLDSLGSAAMGRLPTAAAQAISAVQRARRTNSMKRRVDEALRPPAE